MSSPSRPPASSTRFKLILDGALTEYQKKTKKNLLDYWLATELKSCESIDAILGILQNQAKAIERTSAADQRLMNHIGSSVNVLASISDTLSEGISMVCVMKLIFAAILTLLFRRFHLRKCSLLGSVFSFLSVYSQLLFGDNFDPKFRRQRESKPATMHLSTSSGASRTSSSALRFTLKALRPLNCWKYS